MLQVRAVMKNMIISIVVKIRSIVFYFVLSTAFYEASTIFLIFFIWIFENQVFNVSNICFRVYENLTNKQTENNNITMYKQFFDTCIKSKKQHIYSMHKIYFSST